MSNMSYCRYQNTLQDLRDCSYDLRDRGYTLDSDNADNPDNEYCEEGLSRDEMQAAKSLLFLCREMVEEMEDELDSWDKQL